MRHLPDMESVSPSHTVNVTPEFSGLTTVSSLGFDFEIFQMVDSGITAVINRDLSRFEKGPVVQWGP